MNLFPVDWKALFLPSASLFEIFLRGSIMYLFIVVLLRTVQKRHTGTLSSPDFLFIVLLAASSHYSLTGGDKSITFGIGVIISIVFWNIVLNWLSYRYSSINRFFNPPAISVIKDGNFLRENMRKEFITEKEIKTELRKHGISSTDKVKEAHIEASGEISFILYEKDRLPTPKRKMI